VKQIKYYLLTFAMVLCLFAVILAGIEFFLFWRSHRAHPEERDHVMATEYLPVKFKPNYKGKMWNVSYTTNVYGFRDEPDFPRESGPGELRILSLGDSIGFGVGIEAGEHYCKVAEERIQAEFPQIRIRLANASGQGYSPSGYYAYLQYEGMSLQPSVIIVETELCNDLTDEALLRWAEDEEGTGVKIVGGRYAVAWDGSLLGTYGIGGYPWERTYTYTDFIRRVLNLLNRAAPSPLFSETPGGTIYYSLGFDQSLLDQARIEQGWKRLLAAVEGIHQLCADRQVGFLLLIMPSRYIYDDSAPDHRDLALTLLQRAENEVRRLQVPYVNMSDTIEQSGGGEVFFDFAHLNVEGNRAVGQKLAGLLMEIAANQDRLRTEPVTER
jgi:hypothetical protein